MINLKILRRGCAVRLEEDQIRFHFQPGFTAPAAFQQNQGDFGAFMMADKLQPFRLQTDAAQTAH